MVTKAWAGTSSGSYQGTDGFDNVERLRRLRRLNNVARLMDTALRIPGTNIRFGADSVLGLIPVFGDASGAIVGLIIVNEARKLGVPPAKMGQMLVNLATDAVVGSVPVLGDVFDVYFKSHKRNIKLILDHFDMQPEDLAERRR